jgi:hypothetical protein
MTGEYRTYLQANLAAALNLAAKAEEEYQLCDEDRVARQYWVGQQVYWEERAAHWQRRIEEEGRL